MTGGGNSVWATFPIFSRAGAAGRITLIEEGAKLLDVPAQQCLARNGAVMAGSRSVSFGDIVKHGSLRRTFTPDELAQLPKPASERRLIGPQHRRDRYPGEARRSLTSAGYRRPILSALVGSSSLIKAAFVCRAPGSKSGSRSLVARVAVCSARPQSAAFSRISHRLLARPHRKRGE